MTDAEKNKMNQTDSPANIINAIYYLSQTVPSVKAVGLDKDTFMRLTSDFNDMRIFHPCYNNYAVTYSIYGIEIYVK